MTLAEMVEELAGVAENVFNAKDNLQDAIDLEDGSDEQADALQDIVDELHSALADLLTVKQELQHML